MEKITPSEYQHLSDEEKSLYTRFSGSDEVYYERSVLPKKSMADTTEQGIIHLWKAGISIGDISKQLGIGLYDVTGCLARFGFMTTKKNSNL